MWYAETDEKARDLSSLTGPHADAAKVGVGEHRSLTTVFDEAPGALRRDLAINVKGHVEISHPSAQINPYVGLFWQAQDDLADVGLESAASANDAPTSRTMPSARAGC